MYTFKGNENIRVGRDSFLCGHCKEETERKSKALIEKEEMVVF